MNDLRLADLGGSVAIVARGGRELLIRLAAIRLGASRRIADKAARDARWLGEDVAADVFEPLREVVS
jgi:hypothetical protein